MKRLLAFVLSICLTAVVASGWAVAIGRQQTIPSRITALHLTDCLPPCWIGIVPGKTTIGEARQRIVATFQNSNNYDATFDDGAPTNTLIAMLEIKNSNFYLQVAFLSNEDLDDQSVINTIDFGFSGILPSEIASVPTLADLHALMGPPANLLVLSSAGDQALQYGDDEIGVLVSGDISSWANQSTDLEFYNNTGSNLPLSNVEAYPWFGLSSSISHHLKQCDSSQDVMC